MKRVRSYQVSEVARLTGISVRALHHYDQIGLLAPKQRTSAGYRVYDDGDLLRLQQILIGREQGLALEEIRRSLDDPAFDQRQALLTQKRVLEQRAEQTAQMIRAIDAALELLADGAGDPVDMKQLFNGFDPTQYEAEAKQRWGNTDTYRESAKRARAYRAEDWTRIKAEQSSIYGEAFAALEKGFAPQSPEAMGVAEQHRLCIDRWFYPCSHAMHARLAEMYEADDRFAANIDAFGVGLTPFLSAAIRANAARHERDAAEPTRD
jgi:MerR family transcriptional regulator, thiopeptide resistance regulator